MSGIVGQKRRGARAAKQHRRREDAPMRTKKEQRSYTMSQIKGSGTSIERALRKALWREGVRYRKNYKALPGTPDIAITKTASLCSATESSGMARIGTQARRA